jgi:hypothetical protein
MITEVTKGSNIFLVFFNVLKKEINLFFFLGVHKVFTANKKPPMGPKQNKYRNSKRKYNNKE